MVRVFSAYVVFAKCWSSSAVHVFQSLMPPQPFEVSANRFRVSRPSSKMAWTSDDAAKLQELLQKAAANGVHPLAALEKTGRHFQDDGFELVTTGGMSDATKRLGDDQLPVAKKPNQKSSTMPKPKELDHAAADRRLDGILC